MRKKHIFILISAAILTCLSGCQSTPKESIVKEKNLDEMIDEAKKTDGANDVLLNKNINKNTGDTDETSSEGASEEQKESFMYQKVIEDKNMNIKANIDAKVYVPEVSQMSIWSIVQADITDEMVDKAVKLMAGDRQMYSGAVLDTETKESIEYEINFYKKDIERLKTEQKDNGDTGKDEYIKEYENSLKGLEEKYKSAPDVLDISAYPVNNKLISVNEMTESQDEKKYQEYQRDLNPDGSFFYGITDGKDENYIAVYAQNNKNYSNSLRGRKSKIGYYNFGRVIEASDIMNVSRLNKIEEFTAGEAREKAERFVEKLGFSSYSINKIEPCELQYVYWPIYKDYNDVPQNKVYMITFLRYMDGIMVNNQSGEKFSADSNGSNKHLWPGESVKVYVDESGVVGFDVNAPLEIKDVVVENSKLKSWDEIRGVFESMLPVIYAQDMEMSPVEINIDEVTLSYSRISGKDSFDKGYIVPVWEFFGTMSVGKNEELQGFYGNNRTSLVTINAIDGTIIDKNLGY